MSKEQELTPRELRIVKYRLEGLCATQALLKAGYSRSTAEKQQKRVMSSPRIRKAIQLAMSSARITVDDLASVLKAGLDAKAASGLPDYEIRHRYLETALRLAGFESSGKSSDQGN